MNIYVPSRGRAWLVHKDFTLFACGHTIHYVVSPTERAEYRRALPENVNIITVDSRNIGEKRQKILELAEEPDSGVQARSSST